MRFPASKDQLLLAAIAVGAIIIAIPIFIFGTIAVLWRVFISWASPKRPVVSENIRRSATAAAARIAGLSRPKS
jgi:hypothetical protein